MSKDKEPITDEEIDKAIALEKLRLEFQAAAQTRRIAFWTMIFTSVMSVVTPLMLHFYHQETVRKVDETKAEAKEASNHASSAVKEASKAAIIASTESARIEEKVDATNLQWKAYNSKEPEDMHAAAHALSRVDPMLTKNPVLEAKASDTKPE